VFMAVLMAAPDKAVRKALIDDRKQLVEAASKGGDAGKPRSDFAGAGSQEKSGDAFDFDHFSESIQEPALA